MKGDTTYEWDVASGIYTVYIYSETFELQGFVVGMSAVSYTFLIHFECYSKLIHLNLPYAQKIIG